MNLQVQYPDALHTMMTDLTSIRRWAGFLQKTEIKFDMLSAVDELSKQVHYSSSLTPLPMDSLFLRAAVLMLAAARAKSGAGCPATAFILL